MTRAADIATLTTTCTTCHRRHPVTAHQVMSGGVRYCPTCRPRCTACGEYRGGPNLYGLGICVACQAVGWRHCWRKITHTSDPGGYTALDGMTMHGYPCRLCGLWHASKAPAGVELPADYERRLTLLAVLVAETGYRRPHQTDRPPLTQETR